MRDNLICDVVTLASGQWLNILNNLCGEIHYKKAQPCPSCGGHDRYTFDDLEGRGTYVCRGCGSGDGLSLVAKVHSVNAREAALLVAPYVGLSVGHKVDTAAIELSKRKAEQAKSQGAAKLAAKRMRAATRALAIVRTCIPALASNIYLNAEQVQSFGTYELTQRFIFMVITS